MHDNQLFYKSNFYCIMNIFKHQVEKQPGSGMSKNAKDLRVNPNRDADPKYLAKKLVDKSK